MLGQEGGTKGLRRGDFKIDEVVWRDIVRELGRPGRDPRQRVFIPRILPVDTDRKREICRWINERHDVTSPVGDPYNVFVHVTTRDVARRESRRAVASGPGVPR